MTFKLLSNILSFMENLARKGISLEEYFKIEESSEEKHEFYRGEIYAMSGAKRKHNLIVSNLIITFGNFFKSKPCEVYPSDMRVQIDEFNHYTYPDVSLVCGKSILNEKETTLINPNVIIEVLSESTEKYDRGKKFQAYRNIPSLQNYILVSSEYKQIEVFTKSENNTWILSEPDSEKKVFISAIDFSLNLEDVYDKVEIEEE
ncbi:MAG: Uma2 family endonuclease [Leptospiraceae bacterium]|nr:Uma2 family endonuclease [Leptospiraceae bacterium]